MSEYNLEADGLWLCEKCQSRQTYFTRFCRNCNGDYTLSRDRPAPAEGQAEQADCKYPSCACVGGTTSTCATPPPASAMAGVTEALANLCEEIDRHAIATPIMSTNIMWFKRLALEALAAQQQEGAK